MPSTPPLPNVWPLFPFWPFQLLIQTTDKVFKQTTQTVSNHNRLLLWFGLFSLVLVLQVWLANLSLISKVFFGSLGLVDLALHILQIFQLLHTSHILHILHMLQIRHILHFCFLF